MCLTNNDLFFCEGKLSYTQGNCYLSSKLSTSDQIKSKIYGNFRNYIFQMIDITEHITNHD